jgi:CO/xanthine dehydrogenase FAD-binding subunit
VITSLEYHRPESLEAALALLGRNSPSTRPLAGGTGLRAAEKRPEAVVDLAQLPLSGVEARETVWRIGATTTLEALAAAAELPPSLRDAAKRHAPRNIRQRATVGGVVASRNSGLLLAGLLALDARLAIEPGGLLVPLAVYLQGYDKSGHLIVAIEVSRVRELGLSDIRRAPMDDPIMVVAVGAERAGGALRNVVAAAAGADQPVFLLPGAAQLLAGAPDADAATLTAVTPDLPWRTDGRASAEYRSAMTPILLQRAVRELLAQEANHAG